MKYIIVTFVVLFTASLCAFHVPTNEIWNLPRNEIRRRIQSIEIDLYQLEAQCKDIRDCNNQHEINHHLLIIELIIENLRYTLGLPELN